MIERLLSEETSKRFQEIVRAYLKDPAARPLRGTTAELLLYRLVWYCVTEAPGGFITADQVPVIGGGMHNCLHATGELVAAGLLVPAADGYVLRDPKQVGV